MSGITDRFLAPPSVEDLSAAVPVSNDVLHVAHEDRVVRQVEKLRTIVQHTCSASELFRGISLRSGYEGDK
jgi:hypothetical protein